VRKRIDDRRQGLILPRSIDEFVGPGHRVRVIVEIVNRLDLSAFRRGEAEEGRPAYSPEIFISVIFYAFSLGVFSSREMERRCRSDCAFMFAAAGERLSHRSLSRFRAAHKEELSELFAKVVDVCRRAGLGDTARVIIDGTRQHANASMDAHVRKEQLEKELESTRQEMKKLLDRAAEIDAAEDRQPEDTNEDGGDGKDREKAIDAAVKQLELDLEASVTEESLVEETKRAEPETPSEEQSLLEEKRRNEKEIEKKLKQLEESGQMEANETDPDARLQRFKEGSRPGYNAQIAVSGKDKLILASDVTQDPVDTRQLLGMCDQVEQNTGKKLGIVVADSGYESGENFAELANRGQDAVIASACARSAHTEREKTGLFQWIDFDYDATRDEYVCPEGRRLVRAHRNSKAQTRTALYVAAVSCVGCPLKSRCTKAERRKLSLRATTPFVIAMSKRREHDRRTDRFGARRKGDVEAVFGHMKHNLRWRQFVRRGLAACRSEFRILCAAINLSKLAAVLTSRGLTVAQVLGA